MWEFDYKESWGSKNWCFWTVVLEKIESPLECKEIKPVNPKGNQSWIFIGRTDAEAETRILWPPHVKNWLTGKDQWYWERSKVRGEGDDRGWDDSMASLTQWTWVSASSRSWRWTGKPGVLQSMGSQRVRHNWATELNWLILLKPLNISSCYPSHYELLLPCTNYKMYSVLIYKNIYISSYETALKLYYF